MGQIQLRNFRLLDHGRNGNLDYIHEEDYSEEIWNEQKKQGMRMMQR